MDHWRKYLIAAVSCWLFSSVAFAGGACTYGEAVMAFQADNSVRGLALMKMAAKDGDERAVQYLAVRATDKSAAKLALAKHRLTPPSH